VSPTTILLVRHAEPVHPREGDRAEEDDKRPLTAVGKKAAALVAEQLQTQPITAIYSSPLRRAVETVAPLAEALGLEIQLHDDLAERWLADCILADEAWLDIFRKTWDDIDFIPERGESRGSTQERALRALDGIRAAHPGQTVVASTHGGLIGCLLRALDDGTRFEEALKIPMPAVFALKEDDSRRWLSSAFVLRH
jgi:2,3-bisphosphoglycerate-dependent phosphoglycerate mutase